MSLTDELKTRAAELGFSLVGIAPAIGPTGIHDFFDWLNNGYAGEMGYLERRRDAYEHPDGVLPGVRSVIMLGLNYKTQPAMDPDVDQPRISCYAWGSRDYHKVLKQRLKDLGNLLHDTHPDCHTRSVVDTAPLLERDFARLAGLGWFGKNTMLLNKKMGSLFFLGALLTDIELEYDEPHESSHCGTCTRCLEVCPTDAFVSPYVLDARNCISYLTIELRNPIPHELRHGMGNWIFGCDLCQDVCPWNRKVTLSEESVFQPQREYTTETLLEFLQFTEDEFRAEFQGTPLLRTGRAGLLRNIAIVLGNRQEISAVPRLMPLLNDEQPLIRGAVAWALREIEGPALEQSGNASRVALQSRFKIETDPEVRQELELALKF